MNTPARTAKSDLVLGVLAVALLCLPLPVLLTVDAQDFARLALLAVLVVPPVGFLAIAHRRLGAREMRTESMRVRR